VLVSNRDEFFARASQPLAWWLLYISALWTPVHRLESTVRYLGIEVDDALEITEKTKD
jgi:hypothetical protein